LNVIINYLSIIVVFLFLSIRAVEKRRRKFGGEA
jgi:hypothetical protein